MWWIAAVVSNKIFKTTQKTISNSKNCNVFNVNVHEKSRLFMCCQTLFRFDKPEASLVRVLNANRVSKIETHISTNYMCIELLIVELLTDDRSKANTNMVDGFKLLNLEVAHYLRSINKESLSVTKM